MNRSISSSMLRLVKHLTKVGSCAVLAMTLGMAPAYAVLPIKTMGVPDVNVLGLLDLEGPDGVPGGGDDASSADWGEPITNPGVRTELQQFGKMVFFDMQIGGDGIMACASCHFTAGADNRKTNQMTTDLRRVIGGANDQFPMPDFAHQLIMANLPGGPNGTLSEADFTGLNLVGDPSIRGLPVSETAVAGSPNVTADSPDGTPGVAVDLGDLPAIAAQDVNDRVSSQGPRLIEFQGLHCVDTGVGPEDCDDNPPADVFPSAPAGNSMAPGRQDLGVLEYPDPGFDDTQGAPFFAGFTGPTGIPNTTRHVEPRNTQTVLNAIFNSRSFHDGRADMFYNGVNILGFRDPDAMVRVWEDQGIAPVVSTDDIDHERMNVPFSSLASQAMAPIESIMEMVGHAEGDSSVGRPNTFLGKKMVLATPLFGQEISCSDSLLGLFPPPAGGTDFTNTDCGGGAGTFYRGITGHSYSDIIEDIFDERFWGDGNGNEICLDADDGFTSVVATTNCTAGTGSADRTLKELNFAMFFALGIQAYEATLFTEETIIDLISGGIIPPGTIITNDGPGKNDKVVDLGLPFPTNGNRPGGLENVGLSLEECIELVALNNNPVQEEIATDLCTLEFARFIDPRAEAGTEAGAGPVQPFQADGVTPAPIMPGEVFGGCLLTSADAMGLLSTGYPRVCQVAQAELLNIEEGLGRFEAGATACSACHFDPTFTGATVAANTGFGAPPPEPFIPPGQLAREEAPALTETMIAFNDQIVHYDAGFYNLAVRPTPEDLGVGAPIVSSVVTTDGVIPLSLAKLKEQIAALPGVDPAFDPGTIEAIADTLAAGTGPGMLQLPTSMAVNGQGVDDLTPVPFDITLACGPGLVGNGNGQGEPNNNPNVNCNFDIIPGEFQILRNGAIKTQGLRMVRFTGPHFHTGSKMNLRQVFEFYKVAGALAPDPSLGFPNLNLANLDAALRVINLSPERDAAVVELMETGLTDWRSAYESDKFDHPELCVSNGHDTGTGETIIIGLPAVGQGGNTVRLQTFQEGLAGETPGTHAHDFAQVTANLCTVPGIDDNTDFRTNDGDVILDVPPMEP